MQAENEYERLRLANIAQNQARLKELGIAPLVLVPTTPKASRARKRTPDESPTDNEPQPGSDRKLRPRASPASPGASPGAGAANLSTPRGARWQPPTSAAAANESEPEREYDTPPRQQSSSRTHARTAKLVPLEPKHFQLLADGLDSTAWAPNLANHWIDDMENNFLDNPAVHQLYCGRPCSQPNRNSVVNALKRMARLDGTAHPHNQAAPPFQVGVPLTASSDTEQLVAEAEAWLAKYGADKSNGWLLTHPLRKLRLYQDWKVFGGNGADPAGHLNDN